MVITARPRGDEAAELFHTQTTRTNEMGQTDFAYLKIIGWG